MHTMIKNISLKDAHPSEPLHEKSAWCAVCIKIGLYFQKRTQNRIQLFVPILRFYCFLGVFLPFESVKLNIKIKKSLSSENFCTPGEWALFAFVKMMGIR